MDQGAAPKVSFVSLGCPKALVDSERLVPRLRAEGYELAKTHAGADAVIVNTCGFLDSAKAESLAAIRAGLEENGKVIVTGCMGAEPEQITEKYPGVLAVSGPQAYESVMEQGRAIISQVADAYSANNMAKAMAKLQHALTSKDEIGDLWKEKIAQLGLTYDKKTKLYADPVDQEGEA